jgi:hypothetical protein
MKKLVVLATLALSATCPSAFADDYEVNPDAPNGYNASMAAYHYHGSYRAPTQEQNGYAASEVRSRYGMNSLLVPKSSDDGDSGGRWGSDGGSRWGGDTGGGRWGGDTGGGRWGGRWSGAEAQSSGSDYWSNHFHNRCQPQSRQAGGSGLQHPGEQVAGALLAADAIERIRADRANQPGQTNGSIANPYLRPTGSAGGNYRNSSFLNQYPPGTTALRSAVGATPMRNLLRDSEGGFNHIYTGQ